LTEAFGKIEGYDVSIKLVPWKRGLSKLKEGVDFALFPPHLRPNMHPYMTLYSKFILEETIVVLFTKETLAGRKFEVFPKDFVGLTFVNNAGFSAGGEEFQKMAEAGELVIIESKSTQVNLRRLFAGRANCFANDRLNIKTALNKLKDTGSIQKDARELVEVLSVKTEKGYLGYSGPGSARFPFKEDFIKKLDVITHDMKSTGRIAQIVANFSDN
jgi:polar amino acid transport system substrate-binding protein